MPEVWFPHLGIKISHLNPIAFSIMGIDVMWYGIALTTGLVSGILLAAYLAKKTKQNVDLYMDFALYAIVFSVIGARLYYVIFNWNYYKNDLSKIFAIREGGLAIYGVVIAAVITAMVYNKIKKYNFWLFVDTGAPCLILGQIIGRWGNFVNREAFGGYTDNIFALRYLKDQVYDLPVYLLDKTVEVEGFTYIQVHPTFLYESFWNLCIFIVLIFYRKHKKFNGEIFALYMLGYGLGRVWIEGLRTDSLMIGNTDIRVSQLLAGIIIVLSTGFIVYMRKNVKNPPFAVELTNNTRDTVEE